MTYSNLTKHSSTSAKQAKHTATFTNLSKDLVSSFLLLENGFYMLLETGSKIILEQSVLSGVAYTNQTKH